MPRNNLYDRFMSGPVNPIFYKFFVKANAFQVNDSCIGCGQCFSVCPADAFEFEPYDGNKLGKVAKINAKCTFCNQCLTACKFGAIEEKKIEVQADLGDYKHVWVYAEKRQADERCSGADR